MPQQWRSSSSNPAAARQQQQVVQQWAIGCGALHCCMLQHVQLNLGMHHCWAHVHAQQHFGLHASWAFVWAGRDGRDVTGFNQLQPTSTNLNQLQPNVSTHVACWHTACTAAAAAAHPSFPHRDQCSIMPVVTQNCWEVQLAPAKCHDRCCMLVRRFCRTGPASPTFGPGLLLLARSQLLPGNLLQATCHVAAHVCQLSSPCAPLQPWPLKYTRNVEGQAIC